MPSEQKMQSFDVVILGAGAAGLMCAITAAKRGRTVLVLELSNKPGKKILMSGGGRCNFTNLEIESDNFICSNPHFVKSALSQYTQWDFIAMVESHGIAYHEKTQGQLFCDNSAKEILAMLLSQCNDLGVGLKLNCETSAVQFNSESNDYLLETDLGRVECSSLVVACGGLSIPTLGGASGFAYRLAEQFGLSQTELCASLVPLTLTGKWHEMSKILSGVSLPVTASVTQPSSASFSESLLFTHRGLSGPVILQLSNYWQLGIEISIDLSPFEDIEDLLLTAKDAQPKLTISQVLSKQLPKSLVNELRLKFWGQNADSEPEADLQSLSKSRLKELAHSLHNWRVRPSGTEGYRTAEVTRGGIRVDSISSKTMQVLNQPGLFFIGECLDVTGHLGGYNFQWAWSSGFVAGSNA